MIIIGVNTNDNVDIDAAMNSYFSSQSPKFPYKTLKGLTFSKGWLAIVIPDDDNTYLESNLVKHLSQSLATKVLGYEEVDAVTSYKVFFYDKGVLLDELDTVDFELYDVSGYFSNLDESFAEDFDPSEVLNRYFEEVGFYPTASEILSNIN